MRATQRAGIRTRSGEMRELVMLSLIGLSIHQMARVMVIEMPVQLTTSKKHHMSRLKHAAALCAMQ